MATERERGNARSLVVKRKSLLPRPLYLTFTSEKEGDEYVAKLEGLLDRGIVPDELQARQQTIITIEDAIREYLVAHHVSESDKKCLTIVVGRIGDTTIRSINYEWAEHWVRTLKRERQLSPTTIRHHVGALARCFDWGSRRGIAALAVNPLRLLPRGYATSSNADAHMPSSDTTIKRHDVERDRRLEGDEEQRIRNILAGEVPAGKQRPLAVTYQAALECLFDLALETGMRLREIYTLQVKQVDLGNRTVFLDKTKNGDKRQCP